MLCMVRVLLAPKSCFVSPSTVLAPVLAIQMPSNSWLLALNTVVVHGLVHIVGEVRGCFVLVKGQ